MQDFYIYFQNTNRFVIKISFLSRYRPIYPPFSLILRNFRIFALDLDASATSVKIIFSTFFVIFCFNTLLTTIYQKKTEFGDYHYHDPSGSYRQCLLTWKSFRKVTTPEIPCFPCFVQKLSKKSKDCFILTSENFPYPFNSLTFPIKCLNYAQFCPKIFPFFGIVWTFKKEMFLGFNLLENGIWRAYRGNV